MVRFFDFINVSSKARNAYADRVSPRKVVMPVKSGVLASLLFSVLFISGPVFADAPIPTLDSLKGQEIPDSDPVQYYPESAYTLTEIKDADPENLPLNAVTLYDKTEVVKYYDPQTGQEVAAGDRLPDVQYKEVTTIETTPKYYLVNLKDSVKNVGEGGATKYFEWSQSADGGLELKEVSAPTEGKTTITVNYDTSNLQTRFENTSDNSSKVTTGTFLNQTTGSTSGYQYGGAIYNNGTAAKLGDINADFVGNYASTTSSYASGGAIFNANGTIGDITGDFIGNYVASTNSYIYGGAIYNYDGTIGDITGDFIGNYASSTNGYAIGGAIYNYDGTIGDITGDFIGNYTTSSGLYAPGGAIFNSGEISSITGDFIGNYVSSDSSYTYGGAIFNVNGTIGNITGDFIGNYATSSGLYAHGGAIYNEDRTIGNITGDFIGNYASGSSETDGGAIYNKNGTIESITGDFIGNYASSTGTYTYGGAIFNGSGTIGNITGDFIGNYASSTGTYTYGGAIFNSGTIDSITGDFIGNYATSTDGDASGGAIYNEGTIDNITGDFISNYASGYFASGGAIYNNGGTIGDITGDFIGNYATSIDGVAYGGAIDSDYGTIDNITGDFIGNYAKTESDSQLALGGAVYTSGDMNFIADNQVNYFSGNYTEDYRGKINNAIFVETSSTSSPTIKLQAQNNGSIVFDDQIDGGSTKENSETGKDEIDRTNAYNLSLTGDDSGSIYLNNSVINANITVDNANVYVNEGTNLAQSRKLDVNSGVLNINHLANQNIQFDEFSNKSQINLASVDVDLAKESMGRISAKTYGDVSGNINVQGLNLLNDATKDTTNILFADESIAGSVAYTGASPIAYSPIYKYDVSYGLNDEGQGLFTFIRGGGSSSGSYEAFNPAVVAPSVATQAGAYTTQLQTFNYAFQHADTFMNIPYLERVSLINQGRYALSPTGDATDIGTFSPLLTKDSSPGFWVKPYASFENIPLKNGPKVSNINYGTLVGYDTPITSIANGWERVLTGYIGYNGASQRYTGVDTYQNGGLLGGTITLYKGNFFNATTLSVGASVGDSSNMYGSEDYAMLLAGIGNKTGYNFEFFDGRMILQPSMLISYTFVNTFDYTNSAGLRIESDPLNAIQLAPGIKLIGNTKNGWQPYIGVSMVWNLLQDSRVTANSVRLPEMSIKPYVQYGVGLQKRFTDRFMAYGQAMIHNGGRNGVSLSAGLRWKVGKE